MENNLEIIEINFVAAKSVNVKARADIHFKGFWLKGFKVITDKTGKEYVTPPSYQSGPYWRQLFRTDDKSDWHKIQSEIIRRYQEYLIKDSLEERGNENEISF